MTKSGKPQFFRRKFLINPLQVKFAAVTMLIFGLAAIGVWWEAVRGLGEIEALVAKENPLSPTVYHLKHFSATLSYGILFKSVLLLGIVWLMAIYLSHRYAGPLYRFKKVMEQIQEGDISARVHTRKRDGLKDLTEKFNLMMDHVQARVRPEVFVLDEIIQQLQELAGKIDEGNLGEILSIKEKLTSLKKAR